MLATGVRAEVQHVTGLRSWQSEDHAGKGREVEIPARRILRDADRQEKLVGENASIGSCEHLDSTGRNIPISGVQAIFDRYHPEHPALA